VEWTTCREPPGMYSFERTPWNRPFGGDPLDRIPSRGPHGGKPLDGTLVFDPMVETPEGEHLGGSPVRGPLEGTACTGALPGDPWRLHRGWATPRGGPLEGTLDETPWRETASRGPALSESLLESPDLDPL
jgi:hypothetical protein